MSNGRDEITVPFEDTTEALTPYAKYYGPINISGNAQVQLGDRYNANRDVFETGTVEQQRTAILNLLYYDALDLKKAQLSIDDFGSASFVWVKDTGFYQWLEKDSAMPFWIQGKPASGKSTLMKYLSESRTTVDILKKRGGRWQVLQFFFDYRSGKNTANHILGLLKLFIRQLIKQIPQLTDHLNDEYTRRTIAGEDAAAHLDILANLIRNTEIEVCAFVDGLDEYDGDPWDLCQKLETLRDRTGMKLCLASRPEIAFEKAYSASPGLIMQHYNLASIKLYITSKVAKFRSEQTFRSHLLSTELQNAVAEKSEGVILWARLVIDEMIKSCSDATTTSDDLVVYLDSLPPDMEPLYERILNKQSLQNQQEAAILLMLVDADLVSRDEAVVYQAWRYIEADCRDPPEFPQEYDEDSCRSRVKALLGGLTEIFTTQRTKSEYPPRQFFSVQPTSRPMIPPVTSRKLRLLHKSLSTYLRRSLWLKQRLASRVQDRYLDDVWLSLTYEVISRADDDCVVDVEEVISDYEHRLEGIKQHRKQRYKIDHKRDELEPIFWQLRSLSQADNTHVYPLVKAKKWLSQLELLRDCTREYRSSPVDQPKFANTIMLCHLKDCVDCGSSLQPIVLDQLLLLYPHDRLSWLVDINHKCYDSAWSQLQADKISIDLQTLKAMFDMLVVAASSATHVGNQLAELRQLLGYFADLSIFFDGCHVCILEPKWRSRYATWSQNVNLFLSRRPIDFIVTRDHHDVCPYKYASVGLLHHSMHLIEQYELDDLNPILDNSHLFEACFTNAEDPVYENGKHVFHTLVYHAYVIGVCCFRWLVEADVRPDVSGGPNDLLVLAKRRRKIFKLQSFIQSTAESKPRLLVINEFIRMLEDYRKRNGQWGDTSHLKEMSSYSWWEQNGTD